MPPTESQAAPSPEATRASARRGLLWFALGTLLASAPLEALLLRSGEPLSHPRLTVALLMAPGVVSILVRLARKEGLADISLRVGPRRALLTAWALPIAILAVAYFSAWAFGLEHFEPPPGVPSSMGAASAFALTLGFSLVQGTVFASLGTPGGGSAFALTLGFSLVQGTVFASLGAAGEELGFRGYMLTRLVDAGVRRPALVSALAWALWQLPLVLGGHYAIGTSPALSTLLFAVGMVAHSYMLAKLRLGSGSVWPAIIYRASWAAQLQGTFEAFTRGGLTPPRPSLWAGESGLLVVIAALACALLYARWPWPVRRAPYERPIRLMGLGDA